MKTNHPPDAGPGSWIVPVTVRSARAETTTTDVDDHPEPERAPPPEPERAPPPPPPPPPMESPTDTATNPTPTTSVVAHAHRTAPSPSDATDAFAAARASSLGSDAGTDRPSFLALVPPAKRHVATRVGDDGNPSAKTCNSPSRGSRAASLGRDAETIAAGPACTAAARRNHLKRAPGADAPVKSATASYRDAERNVVAASGTDASSRGAAGETHAYARAPTRRAETPRIVPNAHAASFAETPEAETPAEAKARAASRSSRFAAASASASESGTECDSPGLDAAPWRTSATTAPPSASPATVRGFESAFSSPFRAGTATAAGDAAFAATSRSSSLANRNVASSASGATSSTAAATGAASVRAPSSSRSDTRSRIVAPGGTAEGGNAGSSHVAIPPETILAGEVNVSGETRAREVDDEVAAEGDDDPFHPASVAPVRSTTPAGAPPPHAVNSHAAPPRPPRPPHGEDALPGSFASTKPHPRIVSVAPARADASLGDAEMTSASRYRMDACSAPAEARFASEGGVKFAGRIASRATAASVAGSEQQLVVGSQNCTDATVPPRRAGGASHSAVSALVAIAGTTIAPPRGPPTPNRHTAPRPERRARSLGGRNPAPCSVTVVPPDAGTIAGRIASIVAHDIASSRLCQVRFAAVKFHAERFSAAAVAETSSTAAPHPSSSGRYDHKPGSRPDANLPRRDQISACVSALDQNRTWSTANAARPGPPTVPTGIGMPASSTAPR